MHPSRFRRLTAALAASLTLAALLIAVPAVLVAAAGWPLPTELPSIASLAQAARSSPSPAVVADVLAVIAWAAWVQVAVAILAETQAVISRRPARRLPLLPGLQGAAAKLVATAAFLSAVGQQPAAAAAGSLQAALAAPAPVTAPGHTTAEPEPDPATSQLERETEPVPLTEYRTGPRDTWWQLAETHLGDGLRWRELRQLNLGRHVTADLVLTTDHDAIDEGWTLLLPETASGPPTHPTTGQDRSDQAPEPAETETEPQAEPQVESQTEGAADRWTVTEGDHFWSIAEDTLTDALGRAPTDPETTSYWRELIDTNRDSLLPPHDPDLIYPGQQLARPEPPTAPEARTPVPPEPSELDAPAPETATPTPSTTTPDPLDPSSSGPETHHQEGGSGAGPHGEQARPELEGERRPLPQTWTGAIDQRAEPSTAVAQPEAGSGEAAGLDVEPDRNAWGLPVDLRAGVAASALAAAGVTGLIRRRRRQNLQQRPVGLRLPTPAPEVEQTVRDLDAAAPDERALEDLTTLLCSIPPEARPALVTTTDAGQVTLLFDDDTEPPPPPEPWQPTDSDEAGPVGWHAKLGDHGPIRSIGLPLLATLGRRQDRNVLANLAALRLNVDGDTGHVRRRLRAIALEIATSRTAGPVEVLVLGDELPVDIDQLRHIDDPDAEIASAQAEHDQDVVPEDRTIRLLVAHEPGTAPTVPDELAASFGILAAGRSEAGWLLDLTSHDTGRLRLPDGGWIDLDLPAFEPDHVANALDPEASGREDGDDKPETGPEVIQLIEPAFCEIRILGTPTVIRDGRPVEAINGKALEAITYIATHRDGTTAEQLEDAVWNGRATATGSQRVRAALARARDLLGDGPDGQPLVPRRTKGQRLVGLSEHVATDLDRAFGHLKLAGTLPDQLRAGELSAALELVRGQPFQGWPMSWSTDIHQRAVAQLQDAALELAQLRRAAGDHDAAIAAIQHGLKLCDPAEQLYLNWARIEADRGRSDQVRWIWERLCRKYADGGADDDAWAGAPTTETEHAFSKFLEPA